MIEKYVALFIPFCIEIFLIAYKKGSLFYLLNFIFIICMVLAAIFPSFFQEPMFLVMGVLFLITLFFLGKGNLSKVIVSLIIILLSFLFGMNYSPLIVTVALLVASLIVVLYKFFIHDLSWDKKSLTLFLTHIAILGMVLFLISDLDKDIVECFSGGLGLLFAQMILEKDDGSKNLLSSLIRWVFIPFFMIVLCHFSWKVALLGFVGTLILAFVVKGIVKVSTKEN